MKYNLSLKDKMKELGLSEDTVKNVIKGSDVSLPLGLYTFKDTEKSVVVDGNITTMKALKELKSLLFLHQQAVKVVKLLELVHKCHK